jgi:hypothetical protein
MSDPRAARGFPLRGFPREFLDMPRRGCVLWSAVIYRMTLKSNPRILIIYLLMPVFPGLGIAAIFLLGPLFGIIALLAAAFLVWQMLKLTRRQLATRVETLTEEILFVMHGDEKVSFPWEKIRIAGFAVEQDGAGRMRTKERRLFIYNEENDKMFALNDEFENLDALAAELREHADFREIVLATGETLKGKLRELVGLR